MRKITAWLKMNNLSQQYEEVAKDLFTLFDDELKVIKAIELFIRHKSSTCSCKGIKDPGWDELLDRYNATKYF